MKRCFKCKQIKDLSSFYAHPKMGDGLLGKCKECTKSDSKNRYHAKIVDENFKQSERDRTRERYHRLEYRKKFKPSKTKKKEIISRYNAKYPEKYKCKILSKRIIKLNGVNQHHWSYNIEHAKDTILLSIKDHNTAHRFLKYDQSMKMHRTLTGEILDTKEKHISYLLSLNINPINN